MLAQDFRLLIRHSTLLSERIVSRTCRRRYFSVIKYRPPVIQQRRMMSTPPPHISVSDLTMERYHALSDATMDTLLESLESLLDDLGDAGYELEYHSGVLTLALGEKGTYVINKQPPNKQIWLSSPFSGPKRYDYSLADNHWFYSRDGRKLDDLLNNELTMALNRPVDIDLGEAETQINQAQG